jgi:predicted nucleic acid-binding Zn ribbon protein
MATYIYETTAEPIRRYEIQQSMKDEPLTKHPETGEPIQRVITGGFGYMGGNSDSGSSGGPHMGSCGTGCGCA